MLVWPAIIPPRVTGIVRTSHTPRLASAEVSYAEICIFDLGWKKAKMDKFLIMPTSKDMVKSCGKDSFHWGGWVPLLPRYPHRPDVVLEWGADRLQAAMRGGAFGRTPGHSGQVCIGQVILSMAPNCRTRGHVTAALSRTEFNSLSTTRATSPGSGAFLNLMQMNWKTWWLRSDSS